MADMLGVGKGCRPDKVVEYTPEYYRKLQARARKRKSKGFRKSPALEFYYKQKWEDLQQEFFSRLDPKTGAYLYQNLEHFWRVKFKGNENYQQWAMRATGLEPSKAVPWNGNWALERFRKHWMEDQNVKKIAEQLEQEIDAARVAYSTAPLFLENIGRAKKLLAQVDEEFRGKMFLEGLSPKEKRLRARWYLFLVRQCHGLIRDAVEGLVEAAGGRKSQVGIVFQRFMREHERAIAAPEEQDEQVMGIVQKLLRVAVERHKLFGTELPDPEKVMMTLEMKKKVGGG